MESLETQNNDEQSLLISPKTSPPIQTKIIIMRTILIIILTGLFFVHVNGQISFSPVDGKLKETKGNTLNELIFSSSTMSVKFQLKPEVTVLPQNNMVTVDSQVIQITALKFSGYEKDTSGENSDNQKQLLTAYAKYELEYFKNDLKIEVINPNNQWVAMKSQRWLIWYFKIGNIPTQSDNQIKIQLFASTIIGDKILTINAPTLADADFSKAGSIVNEMMGSLIITNQ